MQDETATSVTLEGNEAAVNIAYKLSEVMAIYPITPSTPMGELAAKDHTAKYHGSSASETLNNYFPEQNTLVVDRQVIEIETVGRTIYFKVREEGETTQIMRLPLNLKQACVMLGMLAVAIGEVSPAKTSQEN